MNRRRIVFVVAAAMAFAAAGIARADQYGSDSAPTHITWQMQPTQSPKSSVPTVKDYYQSHIEAWVEGASRCHARRHVQQHRHQRQHDADAGAGRRRARARLRDARFVLPQPVLSVPAAARSLLRRRSGGRLRRLRPQRHARTGRKTEGAVGQYRCARAVLSQGPGREPAEDVGRADRAGGGTVEARTDRLPVPRRPRRRRRDGAPADVLGAGRRTGRCRRQAGVRRGQQSRRDAEPARVPQAHRRHRRQSQPGGELQVRGRSLSRDPARQGRDVPRRQLDGQAAARARRQERLGYRADPADGARRSRSPQPVAGPMPCSRRMRRSRPSSST